MNEYRTNHCRRVEQREYWKHSKTFTVGFKKIEI